MAIQDPYWSNPFFRERKNLQCHIPGYAGHCPFLRDRCGETFTTSTLAAIHLKNSYKSSGRASSACNMTSSRHLFPVPTTKCSAVAAWHPAIHRANSALPFSARNLSRWKAAQEAAYCAQRAVDLENAILNLPRLVPSANHGSIFENLAKYDLHLPEKCHLLLDGAIIGYQGHIPRLFTGDIGLGLRYSEAARLSIQQFRQELQLQRHFQESYAFN